LIDFSYVSLHCTQQRKTVFKPEVKPVLFSLTEMLLAGMTA